ncbi:hypothetical protein KW797_04345 [Candidatus Parcubacteria bacterium]|nr:hypothetical protein [Candidatus Parcubacteria bacterium]
MEHKTRTFGAGIIIALAVQTATIIWWAAQVSAQVQANTDDILSIKSQIVNTAAVILTREQLQDILGARDARMDSIQDQLNRIERKI